MTTLARKIAHSVSFQESPALSTARRLQAAADLFNRELFNNQLPSTMLRLQNKRGCNGFHSPNKFIDADGRQLDCITLNSITAIDRQLIELLSTLVHEQCHQYVCEVVNHKAAPKGHGPEWRNVMKNLGLPPIRVGETWRGPATHSIDPDGLFARCFRTHASELEAMPWQELAMDAAKGRAKGLDKVRFECPSCGSNVWGRDAAEVICCTCTTTSPLRLVWMIPEFRAEGGSGAGGKGRATASRDHYPEPTQTPPLPVWTDELGREMQLHTGLDHPPQDLLEALVVMLFGVKQRALHLLNELCSAADGITAADEERWQRALKAVWKHRASVLHPDAGGSEEAFKCLQIAYRMFQQPGKGEAYYARPEDVRTAAAKGE